MALSFWQRMFPHRALRREIARQHLERMQERYFDAAAHSTYRKPIGPDVSPQALTQDGTERMRRYVRNLDENNSTAIGILDSLVTNIIGCGLPIQPLVRNSDDTLNEQANMQIMRILQEWGKNPTADRVTTFQDAQRLLCRTWLRDGEAFVQQLRGNVPNFTHQGPVPYTLELIEPDYVPFALNESDPRLIVQGVDVTQYYEPRAYYVSRQHPGDIWMAAAAIHTSESDYVRIPADQMLHLKFTRRVNQVRGQSLLHGVTTNLEDLDDYAASERIAARVASAFTAYIKKSVDVGGAPPNPDSGNREFEMAPGLILDGLLPGEEVGSIDLNRPNTAINDFVAGQLRGIAAGTMSNYSTISRQYEGSYSSQRQSMVEVKPNYDCLRDYFVAHFIAPVYRDLVQLAMMSGALTIPRSVRRDTLYEMRVADVATPWIDPKKETESDILRIQNGLASRTQIITERGGDPLQVAKQIEHEKTLFPDFEVNSNVDSGTGSGGQDETAADEEDTETES